VQRKQLNEWCFDDAESTVSVPGFCGFEKTQLTVGSEDNVSATFAVYVFSEESGWNVELINVE
jgi:hypothetical protein